MLHASAGRGIIALKESSEGDDMASSNGSPGNGNHAQGGGGNSVPRPRAEWIARRKAENHDGNFSQMHYARKGSSRKK